MVHSRQDPVGTDVVVIGGGPAGSTAATLIAQRGYRVELFERDRFPRYHIGESLIPETYWVLERLNMLPKMKRSHFVKKHSVQFFTADGRASAPFYFWDNKPHECSETWQVLRSEFDLMMLDNAREHGVKAWEGARVLDVPFEGGSAAGVKVRLEDATIREVRAKVVVDASGQLGFLMNRLNLRIWDPVLNRGAVWTYFEGAHRDMGRDEGATLVLQTPNPRGWFWYIPLHNNLVSAGVVAPIEDLFRRNDGAQRRSDLARIFQQEVERSPAVKDRLSKGTRVTGYFATKDFSYHSKQIAGDGWVIAGDAAGFLDPLYSSGILLALRSAEFAADAIVEGLAKGDVSGSQLGKWGPSFNEGLNRARRLICEYYDGFSFGNFTRKFPDMKGAVTDLLIGDLFEAKADRVWAAMETMYPPNKPPVPSWDSGPTSLTEPYRTTEFEFPTGRKP